MKLLDEHNAFTNRADEKINPHDPFCNPTESHEYAPDYNEIVPQISIFGCRIPLIPSKREKAQIRRYYTLAGLLGALDFLLAIVLSGAFSMIVAILQRRVDGAMLEGQFPENYDSILNSYFADSSISIGINLLSFLISNVTVFLLGAKLSHMKPADFFRDKNLRGGAMVRYVCVGLMVQVIMGYVASWLANVGEQIGYTMYTPDFSTGGSSTKLLLTVLYGCLVAPITEELVFRGVILKNFSRVSQRFGIFMSALFFALAHENIPQGILAFTLGILLAYITQENNSLVPAIIVHFVVNTANTILTYVFETFPQYADQVNGIYFLCVLFFGAVSLSYMLLTERLPSTTPHQSIRGTRIALSSVGVWVFCLMHLCWMLMNTILEKLSVFLTKG